MGFKQRRVVTQFPFWKDHPNCCVKRWSKGERGSREPLQEASATVQEGEYRRWPAWGRVPLRPLKGTRYDGLLPGRNTNTGVSSLGPYFATYV